MKVTLLSVGRTHDKEIALLCAKYVKRINVQCQFKWTETQDIQRQQPAELRLREGALLLAQIDKSDHVILLDATGKQLSSEEFAGFVEKKQLENKKQVVFIIGGAYGFSDEIISRANEKISLSKMTFPHQLVRLIFLEQLYRAYSILNNEPYHH